MVTLPSRPALFRSPPDPFRLLPNRVIETGTRGFPKNGVDSRFRWLTAQTSRKGRQARKNAKKNILLGVFAPWLRTTNDSRLRQFAFHLQPVNLLIQPEVGGDEERTAKFAAGEVVAVRRFSVFALDSPP